MPPLSVHLMHQNVLSIPIHIIICIYIESNYNISYTSAQQKRQREREREREKKKKKNLYICWEKNKQKTNTHTIQKIGVVSVRNIVKLKNNYHIFQLNSPILPPFHSRLALITFSAISVGTEPIEGGHSRHNTSNLWLASVGWDQGWFHLLFGLLGLLAAWAEYRDNRDNLI